MFRLLNSQRLKYLQRQQNAPDATASTEQAPTVQTAQEHTQNSILIDGLLILKPI